MFGMVAQTIIIHGIKYMTQEQINKKVKVRVNINVDGKLYHFWVTEGTQDEAHEFTRHLSMFIKKEKIWNMK